MPTSVSTKQVLEAAIGGFEAQKKQIDAQIAGLRAMLSSNSNSSTPDVQPTVRKKRRMSAAGRKAVAEAQRKRWAAIKGASPKAEATKPKRKLSAAGRKNIVAALKKRWAAKRAAA